MQGILVGVDVGGSKSVAAVWREDTELTREAGAGAAVRPGRALMSAATIATLARKALTEASLLRADVLVVGAAGVGREPERGDLARALRSEDVADRVVVTTDLELALAAAFPEGGGIVLAAGTGSVAVARRVDGAVERSGGHGWQMGDEGSGYAIGREVLLAVGRARDGRGPDTALTALAQGVTRADDFPALVRWAAVAGVAEIAALAPAALEAAASGDEVAHDIVARAGRSLADLAISLAGRTGMTEVALAGGLTGSAVLRASIHDALTARQLLLRDGVVDALAGAPVLAARPA